MHYPKLRELREAVISLVTPAHTTRFPKEEHKPFPNFRGKPVVNDSKCVGCEACANVCPSGAIQVTDDPERKIRIITRDFGKCIFCGQCEANCITREGVKLSNTLYDLATFDRKNLVETQEKELLLCAYCHAVITTREHMRFLRNKLGPKSYSSLLSLNILNHDLQLAPEEEVELPVLDDLKRKDMFNVICPNCLHKVLVKNLT